MKFVSHQRIQSANGSSSTRLRTVRARAQSKRHLPHSHVRATILPIRPPPALFVRGSSLEFPSTSYNGPQIATYSATVNRGDGHLLVLGPIQSEQFLRLKPSLNPLPAPYRILPSTAQNVHQDFDRRRLPAPFAPNKRKALLPALKNSSPRAPSNAFRISCVKSVNSDMRRFPFPLLRGRDFVHCSSSIAFHTTSSISSSSRRASTTSCSTFSFSNLFFVPRRASGISATTVPIPGRTSKPPRVRQMLASLGCLLGMSRDFAATFRTDGNVLPRLKLSAQKAAFFAAYTLVEDRFLACSVNIEKKK